MLKYVILNVFLEGSEGLDKKTSKMRPGTTRMQVQDDWFIHMDRFNLQSFIFINSHGREHQSKIMNNFENNCRT